MNRFSVASLLGFALLSLQSANTGALAETVVYSFCSQKNCADGAVPVSGLLYVNGTLYGTTYGGGAKDGGVVFSLDPATGVEAVLHSFCSRKNCADGKQPRASLIKVNGTLYGTTSAGGAYGGGSVFSVDPATGAEAVLHSFGNGTDGVDPEASLINVKGTLYGTTSAGGTYGAGTVFSVDPATGAETVLHDFGASADDGAEPQASLKDVEGVLYGTTYYGGTYCYYGGCGTVFSLDPASGAEAVVYSFCRRIYCQDGRNPAAALVYAKDTFTLFGTTQDGGKVGCGNVFALDARTGVETDVYKFCGNGAHTKGGEWPLAGVIGLNGLLYGTTYLGGDASDRCDGDGCGTVFIVSPGTRRETVLHSFCSQQNCADGGQPLAGLINANGRLYGTTGSGGSHGGGTVYSP